ARPVGQQDWRHSALCPRRWRRDGTDRHGRPIGQKATSLRELFGREHGWQFVRDRELRDTSRAGKVEWRWKDQYCFGVVPAYGCEGTIVFRSSAYTQCLQLKI